MPNYLSDIIQPQLKITVWSVLAAIWRKTIGYQKTPHKDFSRKEAAQKLKEIIKMLYKKHAENHHLQLNKRTTPGIILNKMIFRLFSIMILIIIVIFF